MVTLNLFLNEEPKERIIRFCELLDQRISHISLEADEGWFFYKDRNRINISLSDYLNSTKELFNSYLIVGQSGGTSDQKRRIRFSPSSGESQFMVYYLPDRFEVVASAFESAFYKKMNLYPSFSIGLDPRD
jgi:hypothetical protein